MAIGEGRRGGRRESMIEDETYECAGCGGELSMVEAIWLPVKGLTIPRMPQKGARPYCCVECFEAAEVAKGEN
jgi:hypothetical protein